MSEHSGCEPSALTAVAVVLPANDEEELLPRCLRALDAAVDALRRSEPRLAIMLVVVLDACSDGSADVAAGHEVQVRSINEGCVGAARTAGAAAAHDLLGVGVEHDERHVWLACTDADSVVPTNWLTDHVASARAGVDLVLGRVRPDPLDLDEATHREWSRRHTSTRPTDHVHGANLGVRWSVFAAAGGFPSIPEHEDVLLVEAVLAAGARVGPGPEILTSGRRIGRVPGGFSGYLQDLGAERSG